MSDLLASELSVTPRLRLATSATAPTASPAPRPTKTINNSFLSSETSADSQSCAQKLNKTGLMDQRTTNPNPNSNPSPLARQSVSQMHC